MKKRLTLVVLVALANTTIAQPTDETLQDRWAEAMAKFAADDIERPFAPGGVVFVGSSSIRLWDLAKSFPELDPLALNRGFGGSQLADSIRYRELLVLKHKPCEELFRNDGLHLNDKGYELWSSLVQPVIDAVTAND